jgi:hypothetical protein
MPEMAATVAGISGVAQRGARGKEGGHGGRGTVGGWRVDGGGRRARTTTHADIFYYSFCPVSLSLSLSRSPPPITLPASVAASPVSL